MDRRKNFNGEMKKTSYWLDTVTAPDVCSMEREETSEIVVVGAGMTGLMTAMLLSQQGADVMVIDADSPASGTSGRTTAKITVQHGIKYQYMDIDRAACYLKANQAGYRLIEQLIKAYDIKCDYKNASSYVYTIYDNELSDMEKEMKACEKLGLGYETVTETELPFSIKSALKLEGQAQFHPVKFMYGLVNVLQKKGSRVYGNVKVMDIDRGNPVILHTDKGRIKADTVVLATNYPLVELPGAFFLKLHQERSYIICAESGETHIDGMYINAGRPVNSIRTHSYGGKSMLLLGGFGHKTGLEDKGKNAYESLNGFLHSGFNNGDQMPSYGWSSQDCVTIDNIPYVGRVCYAHKNLYAATGYAKWGMTNSAGAAIMLSDLIAGTKTMDSEVIKVFDPLRCTPAASAKGFFKQTANTVKEYTAGNIAMPEGRYDDIKPGKGVVMRINGRTRAVYRHIDGALSVFKGHCTHLGCPLEYNEEENSFDCACHGSRFAVDGSVLEGPAKLPLEKVNGEDGQ